MNAGSPASPPPLVAPRRTLASRAGESLFRWRGLTPLPSLALIVGLAQPTPATLAAGCAVVAAGEWARIRAVAWIGSRSRTRRGAPGALVTGGPFARHRNPLYVANLVVLAGFGIASGAPGPAAAAMALGALQYALVVPWEEETLLATHGDAWRAYRDAVPRWWGRPPPSGRRPTPPYGLRAVLRSERGTLLAQAAVLLSLLARRILS